MGTPNLLRVFDVLPAGASVLGVKTATGAGEDLEWAHPRRAADARVLERFRAAPDR